MAPEDDDNMASLLNRLGRFAARHRLLVVGIWVVVVVGVATANSALGGKYNDRWQVPGAEAQEATDLLVRTFPAFSGGDATVVFKSKTTVKDPAVAEAISRMIADVARQPHVGNVVDPLSRDGAAQVSKDGRIAYATVQYDVTPESLGKKGVQRLEKAAEITRKAGVQTEFGGFVVRAAEPPDTGESEVIGILAAVFILLISFGSVVAMGLPIGTAVFGLGVGTLGVGILTHYVDVPNVAPILATMVGLGVGIDYALFIVTRYRQNLAVGMEVVEAVGLANATAGQAVVFAGGTVVIAILGLWLSGLPTVGAMAYATSIMVFVAVIAAVTLLPALLGLAGKRIDKLHVPFFGKEGDPERTIWARWARQVAAHPWRYLAVGLAILVTLGLPVFGMRLGQSDSGTAPRDKTYRKSYDLLAEGFGKGFNGPLMVVADLERDPEGGTAALARVASAAKADSDVAAVSPPQVSPKGTSAVLTIVPESAPKDEATSELVHRVRDTVVPAALEGTKARVFVGGSTAYGVDIADQLADRLPYFIGAVVALSFLLLMLVFRSLVVPLKAAIMNILSIGAAYGVVVAVFQWGWGRSLVGLEETVPIEAFIPMLMFAILFGLSMDYEVFILSRVREEYLRTGDNAQSVVAGIGTTARVVTSAALIMISVFASFLLNPEPVVKMLGLGLSVAVFVDATIVRIVLVPATMELMGKANWWLPRWLDRILPRIDVEAGPLPTDAEVVDLTGKAEEREPTSVA